jgi:glucokinase
VAKQATIGIDIGGSKLLFDLFNDQFRSLEHIKIKTHADKGKKHFTQNLTEAVEELLKVVHKKDLHLLAVGVGCTGGVNATRDTLDSCPNIPFLEGYPLKDRLAKLTGTNVYIMNDVHAGLYGEHQLGAARGARHVIGVFIGTGIGGALIIDGKLHFGANGRAGDIGNYLIQPIGPLSGSDRGGVLDDVASRVAIAGEAATLAAKQWAPHLYRAAGTDVAEIKSSDLATAIEEGDEAIEELVRSRARAVGLAISNMVDFINPDTIVLGGGLVDEMPKLIQEEVTAGVKAHSTKDSKRGLKIVTTRLSGHAVSAGAAKYALDVFKNHS